jgi:hypothetical protein
MGLSGGIIQSLTGWKIVPSFGVAVSRFLRRGLLDNRFQNKVVDPNFIKLGT